MTDQILSLWKGAIDPTAGCGSHGVTVSTAVRDAMLEFVAPKYGLRPEHIMSRRRFRPYAYARQEVMWRLRRIPGVDGRPKHSYPAIARALGIGDHTTVIHGVRQHEARMAAQ